MAHPPVLCIAGPTASGKSAASAALAKRWPVDIINVDSATIYRGMDIGTAKPSRAEREHIRHHLLDIRDPSESYSAAAFRHDALERIDAVRQQGRIPILSGGTMLYFKALREGLNALPQADPAVRAAIDAEAGRAGWPAMHQHLATFDPRTAARLQPNDRQRIQRAIEVFRSSGRSLSSWLEAPRTTPDPAPDFVTLSLEPSDRLALHERIAQRFHDMLDAGLVAEVARLHARPDLHPGLPSVRCVGYRQMWDWLDGRVSQDTAIERAIAATRQLAKRQLTWLRRQPDRHTVDCLGDDVAGQAVDFFASLRLGD